jgi:hypothetical protein
LKSRITEDFLSCFNKLPQEIKDRARKNYRLWRQNPAHPSLRFKRIHGRDPIYSIRIGRDWRAVGLLEDDVITWFWIGSHADYDVLIR